MSPRVPLDELTCDLPTIAGMCGVPYQTAFSWYRRGKFSEPEAWRSGGPLWRRRTVIEDCGRGGIPVVDPDFEAGRPGKHD